MTTNRMKNIITVAVLTSAVIAFSGNALAENDRRLLLINESSGTIREFYASNIGRTTWEEDILGLGSLPPGHSTMINLDDRSGYCKFDFRTVMETGQQIFRQRIDVCATTSYTIND